MALQLRNYQAIDKYFSLSEESYANENKKVMGNIK